MEGMPLNELSGLTGRLAEIRASLEREGVSEQMIREYFGKRAGKCGKVEACSCKCHEPGETPLPRGKMCEARFSERLEDIVKKMELVRSRVERGEAFLQQVRLEEEGQGFLAGNEQIVAALRKRRQETDQFLAHERGLYMKLAGERTELLLDWEPINVADFDRFVSESVLEMCDILQQLKAPGAARPTQHLRL